MGAINHKKKFVWVWVPKCAGSFVFSHPDFCGAEYAVAGGHEPYVDLISLLKYPREEYFKFAFSRDPYSRIVSAFHHFKKYHNFNVYENFEDFILNNFKGKDGSVSLLHSKAHESTYLRHSPTGAYYNDHFDLQTSFMVNEDGKIELDFVGKTENLPEDFHAACDKIRIDKIENKVLNSTPHDEHMKYFEGENGRDKLDTVNLLYEEDFINFNYEQS